MRKRIMLLAFIFVLMFAAKVSAKEEEDLSEYSFEQVEKTLEKAKISFSYEELVKKLITGISKGLFLWSDRALGISCFQYFRKTGTL